MDTLPADAPLTTPRVRFLRWAGTATGETTLAATFFLALTLSMFGGVLFGPDGVVLSNVDADLQKQFVHWRFFGFRELRAGHLALWNPHIFSGAPYFGGFQSALLYPPNWLYLCLPLARAINVGIALHVFLAGWFMFFWTRHRALHPLACVLAGVLFMFSGPYFPHIYAGHLPNLCTMVWAPLLFLAIDGWLERRTPGWLLLGTAVVALQILAGHPQYVFYTAVAAALYCLLHLPGTVRRWQAVAGLGLMVAGAVGLSAIQLFEGFHAAGESIRSIGTPMNFASVFSFPPENFLTVLVPGFFGDMTGQEYWGRCYLWEMSLFFGISGLVLAIYGAVRGERSKRRFCAVLALTLLVPALGGYTPLFKWFYLYAPGFNKFRGWSKFTYPAVLFLVMLAAAGFDGMLRRGPAGRRFVNGTLAAGLLLLLAAGAASASVVYSGARGPWPWVGWMIKLHVTGEQLTPFDHIQKLSFIRGAADFSALQMLIAACTTLALGAVFLAARTYPRALFAVVVIAVVEMFVFARSSFDTFHLEDAVNTHSSAFLRDKPHDDRRILNQYHPNLAMTIGERDLWGYDPGVLLRYAEWMAATQDVDPASVSQALEFRVLPPSYATLLRCRYIFSTETDDNGEEQLKTVENPPALLAARLHLVSQVRVMHDRDDIIEAMLDPSFNPAKTVILETPPDPPPGQPGPVGSVQVAAETTDSLTVVADLDRAAVLLVTDTYCTGWQATSLLPADKNPQARYTVLPADYCLRGIPLAAGHHRFRLEYRPRAFVIGLWTTVASLAGYLGLLVVHAVRGRVRKVTSRETYSDRWLAPTASRAA